MIEILLSLALQLLLAAQSPNVTPELRAEAIKVATFALQYSEMGMSEPTKVDFAAPPFGAVESVTCVENPVLDLSIATSSKFNEQATFRATYSTGCPLNIETSWNFKSDHWNILGDISNYDYGTTLDKKGWEIENNVAKFYKSGNYMHGENTFTLTIEGLSKTVTK